MNTSSTPPDMTKVHAAELKQLRKNLGKVESDINKEERRIARAILQNDRAIAHERRAVLGRAENEIKIFTAQMMKGQRPLKTQLARIREGRAPGFKERAAIAKRIAVLEGRLAS